MQKIIKTAMHLWISIASLGAFGIGWALISHSNKPAPLEITQPQVAAYNIPTLQPVPSLEDLLTDSSQSVQVFQNQSFAMPRLRTRGS